MDLASGEGSFILYALQRSMDDIKELLRARESMKTSQPQNQTSSARASEEIPNGIEGLSAAQVQAAIAAGKTNADAGVKTRSIADIFRDNICTLFNLVNVILAVLVFFTGSYKNMLFMIIIVVNVVIGIVQEIRSKITTDKLAIVAASTVSVVRDDRLLEIPIAQLVQGDVVRLGRGDQIPADGEVLEGTCKVNESLLTGESVLVVKQQGDELMSGSFINEGMVWARIVHVGAESYASKISAEAKQPKAVNSEIMGSLNAIIKYVSLIMFPVGILLFATTYFFQHVGLNSALLSTVSALVGMIPEGLILLTSTVLAVAVVRLAKRKVLVQQLYCIETLARVDVLCLDKTGTITTGGMELAAVVPVQEGVHEGADSARANEAPTQEQLERILGALAWADPDPNETAQALQVGLPRDPEAVTRVVPFSSDKKYSGVVLADGDSYVMGAASFILANHPEALASIEQQLTTLSTDARVLLVAQVTGFNEDGVLTGRVRPLGFACIQDQIRSTAAQTIAYFKDQGVTLKVISGDDPRTVAGIAQKVGIPEADHFVDATTLTTPEEIARAIETYSVFGRVRPEQKKAFVLALQQAGHTVAMTGDGVNDVLALKAADCSVAMASGSDAARNVAQLVLVDNDFASMPAVVAEGRRSINNLQRSASLFLVKTLLSVCSAVLFILLPWQYPFVPIQMTLISAFTIGLPSFALALEPNHDRVQGRFLPNCIVRSLPGAICAVVTLVVVNAVGYGFLDFSYAQISTLCVLLVAFLGILLVIRLSLPYTPIRWALLVVVVGGTILGVTVFGSLFNIAPFTPAMGWVLAIGMVVDFGAFQWLYGKLTSNLNRAFLERLADRLSIKKVRG